MPLPWLGRRPRTKPLLRLSSGDPITMHQLREGVLVTGATGGGKSSGPGRTIRRLLLKHGVGMVVLVAKPTELAELMQDCVWAGRGADLCRFGPGSSRCLDVIDYQLKAGVPVADVARDLAQLIQMASRARGGDGQDPFFQFAAERVLFHAINAVWSAKQRCSAADAYRFINSLPTSREEVDSPGWRRTSFAAECMFDAAAKSEVLDLPDVGLTAAYVTEEFPALSDRTRTSVVAVVMNSLEPFLIGPVRDIVSSGTTNLTPADVMGGAVVALDLPYLRFHNSGRFVQTIIKRIVQRQVLAEGGGRGGRDVCVYQDESQLFLSDWDVEVQTVARSARLINVHITQSIPVMQQALGGGPQAEQLVQALIGNLQTKFICQQSDSVTNEYFSKLLGHSKQLFWNGSAPTGRYDAVGEMFGCEADSQGSAGFSEQWHPDYPPERFTQLRKGGEENGFVVDAVVFQGGRRFGNGKTWVEASFNQR